MLDSTLYVSDLDGTLLNSNQELSAVTVNIINRLIDDGLPFSVATARSYDSAAKLIEPLDLRLPIIVHNGVFVFDPVSRTDILSNYIEPGVTEDILKIFAQAGLSPIVYTRSGSGESKVYYKGVFNPGEEHYINGRLARNDRRFCLTDDFSVCAGQDTLTILAIGENKALEPVYDRVRNKFDLTLHYTVDIYSKANWLELTHKKANKRDSARYLKQMLGFEKLVCFGDNLNDLPLFEAADESYAVENAHEILKKAATDVIGGNDGDGVAKYLESRTGAAK